MYKMSLKLRKMKKEKADYLTYTLLFNEIVINIVLSKATRSHL